MSTLVSEAMQVDAVHDALVGSVYNLLTTLSELTDDGERHLRLRNQLFPEGISGAALATYEGQVGYAKRLRAQLTPGLKSELERIPVGARTLLQIVSDWLHAGDRLGSLEQERQKLKSEVSPPPP